MVDHAKRCRHIAVNAGDGFAYTGLYYRFLAS